MSNPFISREYVKKANTFPSIKDDKLKVSLAELINESKIIVPSAIERRESVDKKEDNTYVRNGEHYYLMTIKDKDDIYTTTNKLLTLIIDKMLGDESIKTLNEVIKAQEDEFIAFEAIPSEYIDEDGNDHFYYKYKAILVDINNNKIEL